MQLALACELTTLNSSRLAVIDLRLPRWGTDVRNAIRVFENELNFLEGFAGSLWEHEDCVDQHAKPEDAEDDVSGVKVLVWGQMEGKWGILRLPTDIDE